MIEPYLMQDPVTMLFHEVDSLLREQYGTTAWDCGFDDPTEIKEWLDGGAEPQEVVDYYAQKYDLTPLPSGDSTDASPSDHHWSYGAN